jgi:hypothetical protein
MRARDIQIVYLSLSAPSRWISLSMYGNPLSDKRDKTPVPATSALARTSSQRMMALATLWRRRLIPRKNNRRYGAETGRFLTNSTPKKTTPQRC